MRESESMHLGGRLDTRDVGKPITAASEFKTALRQINTLFSLLYMRERENLFGWSCKLFD